jgi:hypothetical protein
VTSGWLAPRGIEMESGGAALGESYGMGLRLTL